MSLHRSSTDPWPSILKESKTVSVDIDSQKDRWIKKHIDFSWRKWRSGMFVNHKEHSWVGGYIAISEMQQSIIWITYFYLKYMKVTFLVEIILRVVVCISKPGINNKIRILWVKDFYVSIFAWQKENKVPSLKSKNRQSNHLKLLLFVLLCVINRTKYHKTHSTTTSILFSFCIIKSIQLSCRDSHWVSQVKRVLLLRMSFLRIHEQS